MKAVVVYESMYGNTHAIADAIGRGLEHTADVTVVAVHDVDAALMQGADLVVVGGPTHVHGMSRASTREAAVDAAEKPESGLIMDPGADGDGVREWLDSIGRLDTRAAAFDTRLDAPAPLTGRASKGIAHKLRQHGCELVADPESFLVTKETHLEPDEEAHARRWGATLAAKLREDASATRRS
ncbi:MAG: flavodoxin domain-containing protein [Acidimicrobiia bacterium]